MERSHRWKRARIQRRMFHKNQRPVFFEKGWKHVCGYYIFIFVSILYIYTYIYLYIYICPTRRDWPFCKEGDGFHNLWIWVLIDTCWFIKFSFSLPSDPVLAPGKLMERSNRWKRAPFQRRMFHKNQRPLFFLSRAVNIAMCSMCVIGRHGESTCRFVGLSVSWLKFEALCCIIPRDSSTSTLFL